MRSSHLTRFREAGGRTPVLVLTARDEVKDRVRGFASDTNVVDVRVRRLRSKVDHPLPLKMIRIACGSGYVLESKQ